jgi:hypothetical protein
MWTTVLLSCFLIGSLHGVVQLRQEYDRRYPPLNVDHGHRQFEQIVRASSTCVHQRHEMHWRPAIPGVVSRKWCVEDAEYHPMLDDMTQQMRLVAHKGNYDALIAMNIGVPARAMYLKEGDRVMIHPEFKK